MREWKEIMDIMFVKCVMVLLVYLRCELISNGLVVYFNEKEMLIMIVIRKIIKEGKK